MLSTRRAEVRLNTIIPVKDLEESGIQSVLHSRRFFWLISIITEHIWTTGSVAQGAASGIKEQTFLSLGRVGPAVEDGRL